MKEEIVDLGMRPTEDDEDKLIGTKVLCNRCCMTIGDLLAEVTQGGKTTLFEFDDKMFKVECLR